MRQPISLRANAKRFLLWRAIHSSVLPLPVSTLASETGLHASEIYSILAQTGWRFLPQADMTFLLEKREERHRNLKSKHLYVRSALTNGYTHGGPYVE